MQECGKSLHDQQNGNCKHCPRRKQEKDQHRAERATDWEANMKHHVPQNLGQLWYTHAQTPSSYDTLRMCGWVVKYRRSEVRCLSQCQTVKVSRTRNSVQEICLCVISSRPSFFAYKKLGWIRTLFYSVRLTWSHVIQMLHRYWLERSMLFLSFNAAKTIVAAAAKSSSPSSAMFLVLVTWNMWHQLYLGPNASNLDQVAYLLCARANLQWNGKWVVTHRGTRWRSNVARSGDGVLVTDKSK